MIDIFLSRPNVLPPPFDAGLKAFVTRLADLDMRPRTLGSTDYGTKAPLDDVIGLLEQCRGAVILGYPQIVITQGMVKGKAISEPLTLATEWNHMEAGLAYARNVPLLVIHHVGIGRGVFDRGTMRSFLFAKDLEVPTWSSEPDISGVLRTWRDEVLGYEQSGKTS